MEARLDFDSLHTKAFIAPDGYGEILEILRGEAICADKDLQQAIYDIHLSEVCFALSAGWSGDLLTSLSDDLRRAGIALERRKKKCPKELKARLDALHDMVYAAMCAHGQRADTDGSLLTLGTVLLRHLSLEPMPIEELRERAEVSEGNFERLLRRSEFLGWARRTSRQWQQFVALTPEGAARLHLFRYAIESRVERGRAKQA